jgi:multidrug transporter EmrE-like cation transporter
LSAGSETRPATAESFRFSHRQSIGLVFLCTLFGCGAQYLIKLSTSSLSSVSLSAILMNFPLWLGLSLYGISTGLLILALRDGELSILYPVISLTYVWVTAMSILVFHESANPLKLAGVAVICTGVALMGSGQKR